MMRFRASIITTSLLALTTATAAYAGEEVLYERAPDWISATDIPSSETEPGKPLRHVSIQVRLDDGQVWQYQEMVASLATPEYLTAMGTVTAQWIPDKGDLRIHHVKLKRDGAMIDVMKDGAQFEVLRREQQLEQRAINGVRTATLAVPGAQVGDELHVAYSITRKDQALGDEYEWANMLVADPFPLVSGEIEASWSEDEDVRYGAVRYDDLGKPVLDDGVYRLSVNLPIEELDEMPSDAPMRFRVPPMLQLSSFDSWQEISSTLAPHYTTADAIAPGTALARQVRDIEGAHDTQLARAAAALQLVQDEISYLFNGLAGGNYLPQSPSETWEKKFGDCKAKSLLLLAMLREMGIEGEVALVLSQGGDVIPQMLPAPGAFDHMIVRAEIDGSTYWLDGTSAGSRLVNIADAPRFYWALPVKDAGSKLVPIEARAPSQPFQDLYVTLDQSAGLEVPALFEAELRATGPAASQYRILTDFENGEEKDNAIAGALQSVLGPVQTYQKSISYDDDTGTAILRAKGIMTSPWSSEDGRYRLEVPYQPVADFGFDNDRARSEWRDIPVFVNGPYYSRANVKVIVPEEEADQFTLLGKADFDQVIGGNTLRSEGSLDGNAFTLTQEVISHAWEVAAEDLPDTKRATTRLARSLPKIMAPRDVRRSWEYASDDREMLEPISDAYAKLIAQADDDDPDPLLNRVSFRWGTGDFAGALTDLDEAIERRASADLYKQRSQVKYELGDIDGALADLQQADMLEPDGSTYHTQVELLGELGRGEEAVELAREYGGFADDPDEAEALLAAAHGWAGDQSEGARILTNLIDASPNDGSLLNSACWYAGTWNIDVGSALPYCDRAVEVGSNAVAALDSRALANFRLGKLDAALADLDTVLARAPALHESRYLRGLIRIRDGDEAAGQRDIRAALTARPSLAGKYRAWGLQAAE